MSPPPIAKINEGAPSFRGSGSRPGLLTGTDTNRTSGDGLEFLAILLRRLGHPVLQSFARSALASTRFKCFRRSGCCAMAWMPRGPSCSRNEGIAGFALEDYPHSIIGASESAGMKRSAIDRLVGRRVNSPRQDLERRCRSRSCPGRHDR